MISVQAQIGASSRYGVIRMFVDTNVLVAGVSTYQINTDQTVVAALMPAWQLDL